MGDLISLADHRTKHRATAQAASARAPVTFYFDLASPYTYLAAERVERLFADVRWVPVLLGGRPAQAAVADPDEDARTRAGAEHRAAALRMPLVWPDAAPSPARAAMRVAALAADRERAAAFVLAASRLAFCGGFDVDDPDILAEACAAASLPLDACLQAAGDRRLDEQMLTAGFRLLTQGGDGVPTLRVGRTLFYGEHRLAQAAAAARSQTLGTVTAGPRAPSAM